MAARLTHLEILKQCLHLMEHGDAVSRKLALKLRNHELFRYACLGSIAPDLYYFYHPLSRKKNQKALYWGNLAHHHKVCEIMLAFLDDLKTESPGPHHDKKLAFVLGYLSHCAADIITHPYIFYITGDYYSSNPRKAARAQEKHLRIEFALDSYMLHQRWGMSPREYDYLHYLADTFELNADGDRQLDRDIWRMWVRALRSTFPLEFERHYMGSVNKIERGDILNEAYLGFLKFSSITDARSRPMRFFLRAVDHLTLHRLKTRSLILPAPQKVDPRIANEERREWKYPADPEHTSKASFIDLVNQASRFAEDLVQDALAYINNSMRQSAFEKKYLEYNLDTGIRSGSLKMHAFSEVPEPDYEYD